LADAIGYALNHWQAQTRYASDGRIEIDNNAAERALRAVALGRKNFLFAGSDAGGDSAAAIYSLVGSVKSPRKPICVASSSELPTTQSINSTTFCLGMSQNRSPRPSTSLLLPDSD